MRRTIVAEAVVRLRPVHVRFVARLPLSLVRPGVAGRVAHFPGAAAVRAIVCEFFRIGACLVLPRHLRGGVGGAANNTGQSGVGGVGLASAISGSSVTYSVGGSGHRGWAGSTSGNTSGWAANPNTGHGGTGNSLQGMSGVVILRMLDANYSGTTTGSPTVATNVGSSGYTTVKFTGSGTYTA